MSIIKSLPVSTFKRLDDLKSETAKDENLQKLTLFIREGRDDKRTIPCAVKPYLTHQDEISEAEGIMLRGSRIIVPTSIRREMKSRIHEGHLGPRHRKV